MHEAICRLMNVHSVKFPVLTVYLDTRPMPSGMRAGHRLRPFQTYLRGRLRDLGRALSAHGESRESFERDCEAVWQKLAELEASTQGVAIVACHGQDLFEMFAVEQPFENQVSLGAEPVLYPLARYLEGEASTYAVVVADAERARVYSVHLGHIEQTAAVQHSLERPELPGRSGVVRGTLGFGASQLKYQRYLRNQAHTYFAEVVEALERVVARESIPYVILGGSDRVVADLLRLLPPALEHKVIETMRLASNSPQGEVLRATLGQFQDRLEGARLGRVEELLREQRLGGLATAGAEATLEALYRGQVEELLLCADCQLQGRMCSACQRPVLDPAALSCPDCEGGLGPVVELREELIRQAARTGAHLEVLGECEQLSRHEGLGALLRYADTWKP